VRAGNLRGQGAPARVSPPDSPALRETRAGVVVSVAGESTSGAGCSGARPPAAGYATARCDFTWYPVVEMTVQVGVFPPAQDALAPREGVREFALHTFHDGDE